jgi:nicotinate-nucleotide adenylyltransferase
MRTLCYGGSFNPIHHGHLMVAQGVADAAGFDRVVLIPSARPPHKQTQAGLATPQRRLTMCQLAVQNVPKFAVSNIEMRSSEPSYTLSTVRRLHAEGWEQIHWLIGADTVSQLPKWHKPQQLMAEVRFLIAARPGWVVDWEQFAEPYRSLRQNVVEAPLVDVSSTQIRRRVAAGQGIDFLVPPAVVDYIRREGLYQP